MKIAVAVSSGFDTVAGHAGRAKRWLVFPVSGTGEVGAPERVELEGEEVFHHVEEDGSAHKLDGITALLAASAGEGFLKHMEKRGVEAKLTGESDPAQAVAAYLAEKLPPPKPRPIGSLICKVFDLFSKHK